MAQQNKHQYIVGHRHDQCPYCGETVGRLLAAHVFSCKACEVEPSEEEPSDAEPGTHTGPGVDVSGIDYKGFNPWPLVLKGRTK